MVEVNLEQAEWRKATASGDTGQCVEVATNIPNVVAVRDSNNPTGPALIFTRDEWTAFLHGATHGEFDV
ncbi:DUF397 domain-containing protein [Nonomuraea sp. NPDC049141]|uniref:DUF397 domain-containing protein n=1 Tax=Nonomuraea sp. NPDC049141 TaxID=3155500 RepID=UPI00340B5251